VPVNAIKSEVLNWQEVQKQFQLLPFRIGDKVIKGAIRSASTPIVNAMKSRAPRRTGLLAKGIRARVVGYSRNGAAAAAIGASSKRVQIATRYGGKNHGQAVFVRPSKYAHLVEYGNYGNKGATNFMARGWAAATPGSKSRFLRTLQRGTVREARKLGFK